MQTFCRGNIHGWKGHVSPYHAPWHVVMNIHANSTMEHWIYLNNTQITEGKALILTIGSAAQTLNMTFPLQNESQIT